MRLTLVLALCGLAGCVSLYDVGAPVVERADGTVTDTLGLGGDAADAGDASDAQPGDATSASDVDATPSDVDGGPDGLAMDSGETDAPVDSSPEDVSTADSGGVAVDGWAFAPAGSFVMGSPPSEAGRNADETQHTVLLTRAFEVMENEVTNDEWARVFGTEIGTCGVCPVASVTWFGAVAYANALSREAGLEPCYDLRRCDEQPEEGDPISCQNNVRFEGLDCEGYRLPTEAEWEYAARAGATGPYPNEGSLSSFAMCQAGAPTQVGTRPANAWGVRDVLGNVDEWVFSTYAPYETGEIADPVPQSNGAPPVKRGGGFDSSGTCRLAGRENAARDSMWPGTGFRLVRTLPSSDLRERP